MHCYVRYYRYYRSHLCQTELARAVGVSRVTIGTIEKGTSIPSIELALKISQVLKTPVQDLFVLDN